MNPTIPSIPYPLWRDRQTSAIVGAWQVCAIVSMLVFTSLSFLDLRTSALFYDGATFPASQMHLLEIIRQVIWMSAVIVAFLCLIGCGFGLVRRHFLWVHPREWMYSTLLVLLGPVLIVNEGLKSFWGRARPAEIIEFGGNLMFTPALVPTEQCARNCSFVSGEGSGAVALAIVGWVLTEHIPSRRVRSALRLAALVMAFVGSFLRIATGRHFLSDTIFAALIVTGLALLLRPILSDRTRPQSA